MTYNLNIRQRKVQFSNVSRFRLSKILDYNCILKVAVPLFPDFKSKEMCIRQKSVALYFIDKLAFRAGNEKDGAQTDTTGCCSLRVKHVKLHKEHDSESALFDLI